jgi:hypothetical protein
MAHRDILRRRAILVAFGAEATSLQARSACSVENDLSRTSRGVKSASRRIGVWEAVSSERTYVINRVTGEHGSQNASRAELTDRAF